MQHLFNADPDTFLYGDDMTNALAHGILEAIFDHEELLETPNICECTDRPNGAILMKY